MKLRGIPGTAAFETLALATRDRAVPAPSPRSIRGRPSARPRGNRGKGRT